MSSDLTIRAATDEDWSQIFPFWARIVDDGRTYAYPEGLTSPQAHALWMEAAPGRTVVAESGDRVIGSAKMGPNRPGRGSHIATASFMVDPEAGTREWAGRSASTSSGGRASRVTPASSSTPWSRPTTVR
ncbi:GNAT family N-acetyltransferase [Janibacter hoylei]|uniref:GNAT family N-acetyltransferase n=1 Tax=Janibacter hoylei TaxID=364298 RepID=UPI002AA2A794|nr:hypothetical protein [Janibacter hoylei]